MEDIVSFPTLQWTLSESVYQRSYLVPAKKIDKVARMSATSYKAVNLHLCGNNFSSVVHFIIIWVGCS